MPPAPAVSVVVPTHNRAGRLPRLVAALAAQGDGVPFEVVVADDASTDGTAEVLGTLAAGAPFPLRVVRRPANGGAAAARNSGWRAAGAPLVAFTDDDCAPQPGWVAALAEAFAEGVAAVQGPTYPDPAQHRAKGPFTDTIHVPGPSVWFETTNVAYRREWLDRLGGFDEGFGLLGGEDTDLGWRLRAAGGEVAFAPRAAVLHDVRPVGFAGRLRGLPRWEGIVRLVARHPGLRDHLHGRWFWKPSHPRALLAAAGLGAAAATRHPAAVVACAPYLLHRLGRGRLPGGLRAVPAVPLALAADLAEVAVLARASARYRTLVL